MADTSMLCDFCNGIDFSLTGLYPAHEAYALMFSKAQELTQVLENSAKGTCYLCGKVASLLECWQRGDLGGPACLDLTEASVFVGTSHLRSLEREAEDQAKRILLRLHVRFSVRRPFPDADWFGPIWQFQGDGSLRQSPRDNEGEASALRLDAVEDNCYGRVRPLLADCRLFRKWEELCSSAHGEACRNYYNGERLPWIRLLDVEARCIAISHTHDIAYIALSYVWGKASFPRLTTDTLELYKRPGSLSETHLPKTIADAIELTQRLGKKYLWVDCLCIIQDDDGDKLKFIPKMDSVYGFASLTIIAASGASAGAGLPGLSPGSRTQQQDRFTIKGTPLISSLDDTWEGSSLLDNAVWNKRGWTFQEGLFSGRTLIFTSRQVYWGCQRASWCEDTHLENTAAASIFRHSFIPFVLRDVTGMWQPGADRFDNTYRDLVEVFSSRDLSFQGDGLDAFAGVLNALERSTGQSFFWALPTSFFSNGLRWIVDKRRGNARRKETCTPRMQDGAIVQCRFPSWSWVGWSGEIPLAIGQGLTTPTASIKFYRLDRTGEPIVIPEGSPSPIDPDLAGKQSPPTWRDQSSTTILRSHIPPHALNPTIAPSILAFYSSVATLTVRHQVPVAPTTRSFFSSLEPLLITPTGKQIYADWNHMPRARPGEDEEGHFVIITRHALPGYPDRLAALMIGWEDGVAYRRGMVSINTGDWNDLENRTWRLVVMA
jgi:Heterokaryon incompatibility protein (HET)